MFIITLGIDAVTTARQVVVRDRDRDTCPGTLYLVCGTEYQRPEIVVFLAPPTFSGERGDYLQFLTEPVAASVFLFHWLLEVYLFTELFFINILPSLALDLFADSPTHTLAMQVCMTLYSG